MKNIITINLENDNVRIDRFIRNHLSFLAQSDIEQLLRKKDVALSATSDNSDTKITKKLKSNYRLQQNDALVVSDFFIKKLYQQIENLSQTSNLKGNNEKKLIITFLTSITGKEQESFQDLEYKVESTQAELYFPKAVINLAKKIQNYYLILDEPEFIAINKPHELAVQGGSKLNISIDSALQYLNYINQDSTSDLKLVHRLDKSTSGVLIIAKGAYNAKKLAQGFAERLISKEYVALISNFPQDSSGIIKNYIGKVNVSEDLNHQHINITDKDNGKLAITEYEVMRHEQGEILIKLKPLTGRMHQLRVHCSHIESPILGDVKYGGQEAGRLYLHARKLSIPHEIFGRKIDIESSVDWGS
jgi:23S rRNA pseudouridine955/2504/2580 synthase